MKSKALAGSALVALGVATGSLLAPQAASALDFTFSFGGTGGQSSAGTVTGLITNLGVGANTCDGSTACVVTVTSTSTLTGQLGTYNYAIGLGPGTFVVSSSGVLSANWTGTGSGIGSPSILSIFDASTFQGIQGIWSVYGTEKTTLAGPPVTFAAVQPPPSPASVPGPLPILGLAAAFGFSRKLRKRIKLHKGSSDISNSAGA